MGSFNVITTFYNKHVGLNNFTQVVGNNILNRIGSNFEIGVGLSNKTQLGAEQDWYGGTYSEIGTGIWSENKLAAEQKNTLGVSAKTNAAVCWESIVGAKFLQTTGILSDTAQGIKFNSSFALNFNASPLDITA